MINFNSKSPLNVSFTETEPIVDYKSITNEKCAVINEKFCQSADLCVRSSKIMNKDGETIPHLLLTVGE